VTARRLRFLDLDRRHPGLTGSIASAYSEAARVCLDRHHVSPVSLLLSDNDRTRTVKADWQRADKRTTEAWGNKDDATEAGAYALSLAAIEAMRGLVALRRAETLTGADYYLGRPGGRSDDLEAALRLEVSGTDEGNNAVIQARLRLKKGQARQGKSNLPAVASVVGFAALRILTEDVEGT
jgi:hypothetical protein